ncbi:MAG: hypothetical protein NW216_10250 [Hyphomicrobium sp.]|nr:hypothetical protein [Hyphomicrobium sp.]
MKIAVATLGAAAIVVFAPLTAEAGHRCEGKAVACYEKVRMPDFYRTVERRVLVRPARTDVYHRPAVVGRRLERVVVEPGRVHHVVRPAVYSTVVQKKLVVPASVEYRTAPAVVRTVHETVVVKPGRERWVHKVDRHGRETKCLVRTEPVTKVVPREVVVRPAVTVPVVRPAVYAAVPRTVLVRPESAVPVYEPPVTRLVDRPVVLRPAETHVVARPAEFAVERHAVRVR